MADPVRTSVIRRVCQILFALPQKQELEAFYQWKVKDCLTRGAASLVYDLRFWARGMVPSQGISKAQAPQGTVIRV